MSFDLKGKRAFVAGVGDDQGFGWAIAKALAEAGAEVIVGTWPPVYRIFTTALETGKFKESQKLKDGSLFTFSKVFPLDALYDRPEDVPEEVRTNKRYIDLSGYTLSEVAASVAKEYGQIDILVHSLANAPEIKKPLLETSRHGYLTALSASSYSFVSLLAHFGPHMNPGGAALTLSYIAADRVLPGYGGGMSTAKSALEGDVRTLAWEAGRKWSVRVNAISAGPLRSRAARAIGFIDLMISYSRANAPLAKELEADEVAHASLFLLSPYASAVTGEVLFVDNGLHAMGVASDSQSLMEPAEIK